MAIGDYDVLARASRVLRAVPETGWTQIEEKVIRAVRDTPRGGWPIAVVDPVPDASGRIAVTDLVVRTLIAQQVPQDPDVSLIDVDADVDDGVLRRVAVEISGRFGSNLTSAAERVRAVVSAVVTDATGRGDVEIDVAVTDVHR